MEEAAFEEHALAEGGIVRPVHGFAGRTAAGLLIEGDGDGDLGGLLQQTVGGDHAGDQAGPLGLDGAELVPGAWSPGNKLAGLTNGFAVATAIGNDGSIWHTVRNTNGTGATWARPQVQAGP